MERTKVFNKWRRNHTIQWLDRNAYMRASIPYKKLKIPPSYYLEQTLQSHHIPHGWTMLPKEDHSKLCTKLFNGKCTLVRQRVLTSSTIMTYLSPVASGVHSRNNYFVKNQSLQFVAGAERATPGQHWENTSLAHP